MRLSGTNLVSKLFARLGRAPARTAGFGAFCAGLILIGMSCGPLPSSLSVPLNYSPTDLATGAVTLSLTPSSLFIAPVDDRRVDNKTIGQNTENANPIPVFASGRSAADFVHQGFATELSKFGNKIVDSPAMADRTINIALLSFFVAEGNSYEGQVTAQVSVLDKNGTTLWAGNVAGQDSTYGRSLNPENYQQVLSNATMQAADSLAGNPAFMKAASTQP